MVQMVGLRSPGANLQTTEILAQSRYPDQIYPSQPHVLPDFQVTRNVFVGYRKTLLFENPVFATPKVFECALTRKKALGITACNPSGMG